MSTQLLDIKPRDLKFIFELKKQSSCSVSLYNKTDFPVAYKVKTTSPKKYCVRPNVGILKPNSSCVFIVTMQAQKAAPLDLICKDKFLVQSTIVPEGTTDEDIKSSMFSKDNGKHVEENKLKVVLVSPPQSPVLSPLNGVPDQMPVHEALVLEDQVFNGSEIVSEQKKNNVVDISLQKSYIAEEVTFPKRDITEEVTLPSRKVTDIDVVEDITSPNYKDSEDVNVPLKEKEISEDISLQSHGFSKDVSPMKNDAIEDISVQKNVTTEDIALTTRHNSENISQDNKVIEAATESYGKVGEVGEEAEGFEIMRDVGESAVVKDIERMESKLNALESKLSEAEITISKLIEERRLSSEERESLMKELADVKSRTVIKRVQVGFPFLFVAMVALTSMVLGYLFRC